MARGWESKSVEAQQEAAVGSAPSGKSRLSPQEVARHRQRESLRLSLQRVLQQLEQSQNPRHRIMLEQAQFALQEQIRQLGD